ncbi:MAG: Gfo/Idh/MocA family oxidoreductase [Anaerolineales bacterium]|nr:Gfo/Idh/MocA family oxidoreductase [Anaerolineales bacterium]
MSSDRDLKVGVVGAGFIGPAHVEALRRSGVHVVGISENTPERAQQRAADLRLEKAYESFDAMVADPALDVIHITSPNHLHYPQAKAVLMAGKHVVCEKPLAMNTSESAELLKLARERNLVNAVNFNIRFYPLALQARSIVKSEGLGDVYIVQGSYLQDWLLLPTDWNWRLEPGLGGEMRAVADIGSHWLDLVTFITGLEVEAVFADFKTFLPTRRKPTIAIDTFGGKLQTAAEYVEQEIHTEDYATVLLHFNGGARGVLTVSQVSAGRKNRLYYEIDGAKSAMSWDSERPNELWLGHRERPNEVLMKDPSLLAPEVRTYTSYPGGHNEGFPDTFKQLYVAVYNYIRAGDYSASTDFATFADGHMELLIGEAILRSAKEGRWVNIE